jgi:hypothetical protein
MNKYNCKNCKSWEKISELGDDIGICKYLSIDDEERYTLALDDVRCIHFEQKEKLCL